MSTTVHEEIVVGQIVIRLLLDGEASGGTVAMFEFAKAKLTGEKPNLGEKRKVTVDLKT